MWIGHRKEIRKLTFRALALRRSESGKNLSVSQTESIRTSRKYEGDRYETDIIMPIFFLSHIDYCCVFIYQQEFFL